MTTFRNILTSDHSSEEKNKFTEFYNSCALFKKLVDNDSSLTAEELDEIKSDFSRIFPDSNFEEFLTEFNINSQDDVCFDEKIYCTRSKKSIVPQIYSALNKKQTSNFNMQEFLRESIANNQTYYLNFDPDPDFDMENEDDYQERNKQMILADQALKSIGTIALCLNKQRKDIPYTLMDVKAENFIN